MIWKSLRVNHIFCGADQCLLVVCCFFVCLLVVCCLLWFVVVLLFLWWLLLLLLLLLLLWVVVAVVVFPQAFEVYFLPFLFFHWLNKTRSLLFCQATVAWCSQSWNPRNFRHQNIIGIRENDPPHHATSTSLVLKVENKKHLKPPPSSRYWAFSNHLLSYAPYSYSDIIRKKPAHLSSHHAVFHLHQWLWCSGTCMDKDHAVALQIPQQNKATRLAPKKKQAGSNVQ